MNNKCFYLKVQNLDLTEGSPYFAHLFTSCHNDWTRNGTPINKMNSNQAYCTECTRSVIYSEHFSGFSCGLACFIWLPAIICEFVFPPKDWPCGDWSKWHHVHSVSLLCDPQDKSSGRHYSHSQPQPRRTQWRLWHQVQHLQWR